MLIRQGHKGRKVHMSLCQLAWGLRGREMIYRTCVGWLLTGVGSCLRRFIGKGYTMYFLDWAVPEGCPHQGPFTDLVCISSVPLQRIPDNKEHFRVYWSYNPYVSHACCIHCPVFSRWEVFLSQHFRGVVITDILEMTSIYGWGWGVLGFPKDSKILSVTQSKLETAWWAINQETSC